MSGNELIGTERKSLQLSLEPFQARGIYSSGRTVKLGVEMKTYKLGEALKAQRALRDAADLGEEAFPVQAFLGMISDEVEALRKRGKTDDEIAEIIEASSEIKISGVEISENYASPDKRHQH